VELFRRLQWSILRRMTLRRIHTGPRLEIFLAVLRRNAYLPELPCGAVPLPSSVTVVAPE
jgi:hypothetical protein